MDYIRGKVQNCNAKSYFVQAQSITLKFTLANQRKKDLKMNLEHLLARIKYFRGGLDWEEGSSDDLIFLAMGAECPRDLMNYV